MTIVRKRHPFDGQALEVLGWAHRGGVLQLILVLPDGTRSLIPAAWTNLHQLQNSNRVDEIQHKSARVATLASIEQLRKTRIVVDALLRRLGASIGEAPTKPEENKRAIRVHLRGTVQRGRHAERLGSTRRGAKKRRSRRASSSDRQSGDGRRSRGRSKRSDIQGERQ